MGMVQWDRPTFHRISSRLCGVLAMFVVDDAPGVFLADACVNECSATMKGSISDWINGSGAPIASDHGTFAKVSVKEFEGVSSNHASSPGEDRRTRTISHMDTTASTGGSFTSSWTAQRNWQATALAFTVSLCTLRLADVLALVLGVCETEHHHVGLSTGRNGGILAVMYGLVREPLD